MAGAAHIAFTMGGICSVGGVIGYAKSKSLPSLIAGVSFGSLFAISGYLISKNKDYGVELATVTSGVLFVAMGRRAVKTRKPVPATLAAAGLLSNAYYAKKWFEQYY
ncbi:hypothetical protein HK098_001296 [Nowakowskiella sp. JEL0407]|nr:hypothetical protein HK098_001296 [Nowakowskiella sp. JEL0407]